MSAEFGEAPLRDGIAEVVAQPALPMWRLRGGQRLVALSTAVLVAAGCSSNGGDDFYPTPTKSATTEAAPSPTEVETSPSPSEVPTAPGTTPSPIRSYTSPKDPYTAVYFQPLKANLANPDEKLPRVLTLVAEPGNPDGQLSWTSTERCDPRNGDAFLGQPGAADIRTVLTFSLGRVGFAYMLDQLNADQQRQFNYAIIVDPGNMEDMTDSCDPRETSTAILNWLNLDPKNRLVVIAGEQTAQGNLAGVRAKYTAGIASAGLGRQVILCVNSGLSHPETWERGKALVGQPKIKTPEACPDGFVGSYLQS